MSNNDDQIILAAQQGDQSAMEQVFAQYKSIVRSIANSYFLIGGDKEDLLQEGMYGLFKAVRDYRTGNSSFCTFAYTCILRQVINAVKRYSSAKNKPMQFYVPLDDQVVTDLATNSSDPLDLAIAKENQNILKQKIQTGLSAFEQSVVRLFIKGYSYEEIAKNLSKSAKSVDCALQRVRKKLAEGNL